MSVRGSILNFQAAQEWARAVNLIDVVFNDAPDVVRPWHELYAMLQHKEEQPGQGHKKIDLLYAMAVNLGYISSSGNPIGRMVGGDAMQFAGWQRLNAEYAQQFGVETPSWPPKAAQNS